MKIRRRERDAGDIIGTGWSGSVRDGNQRSAEPAQSVHVVGISTESAAELVQYCANSGVGIRRYATIPQLIGAVPPDSGGVVVIQPHGTADAVRQISEVRKNLPRYVIIVAVLKTELNETDRMMRAGAWTVVSADRIADWPPKITEALAESAGTAAEPTEGAEADRRISEITRKEKEVLDLVMKGARNKDIAAALGITVRAVEDRRFRMMRKVGVDSVAELITLAVTARFHRRHAGAANGEPQLRRRPATTVKGVEIWLPTDGGNRVELTRRSYRNADSIEALGSYSFIRGEGIPGRVKEQRRPVFMKDLEAGGFVRHAAAASSGVTCAVGFPIFSRGEVTAVIVLLLDANDPAACLFESWRHEPGAGAYRLADGLYLNCESLRRLTEFMVLPPGIGLSGYVSEGARPFLRHELNDDPIVVRGAAMTAAGVTTTLALPLTDSGAVNHDVLVLGCSSHDPLFPLTQVWRMNPGTDEMQLTAECYEGSLSLSSQTEEVPVAASDGLVGHVMRSRTTVLTTPDEPQYGNVVGTERVRFSGPALAVPTIVNGRVVSVTVIGF